MHKDVLKNTIEFYPKAENHDPNAIWAAADAKVTRNAAKRTVEGKVFAIRSYFEPGRIQVQEGDTVVLHITNGEQARDEIHGFGLVTFDKNIVIDPGETKTLKFMARKSGRVPVLLHQLLLGAPPGDAGLSRGGAPRPAAGALPQRRRHDAAAGRRSPSGAGRRGRDAPIREETMSLTGFLAGIERRRTPLLLAAAALLAAATLLPLWGMILVSTQYPDGLRMVVYPTRIVGDLGEINALNHYIGMTPITDRFFLELRFLQPALLALAGLAALAALVRERRWVAWLPLAGMLGLAAGGLGIMRYRLWQFGHQLDRRPRRSRSTPSPHRWSA